MIQSRAELTETLNLIRDKSNGMLSTDYTTALRVVGLAGNQYRDAAAFFGVAPRTAQRWAYGEQAIPLAVQDCLEYMTRNELKAEDWI